MLTVAFRERRRRPISFILSGTLVFVDTMMRRLYFNWWSALVWRLTVHDHFWRRCVDRWRSISPFLVIRIGFFSIQTVWTNQMAAKHWLQVSYSLFFLLFFCQNSYFLCLKKLIHKVCSYIYFIKLFGTFFIVAISRYVTNITNWVLSLITAVQTSLALVDTNRVKFVLIINYFFV